jgi:threonine dehydratase
VKIKRAAENGAEIVLYDRNRQSREEIAAQIAGRSAVAVIPPGDNLLIPLDVAHHSGMISPTVPR